MDDVIDDIILTVERMDSDVSDFFFRNGNAIRFIVLALWEADGMAMAHRHEYDDIWNAVEVMLENPSNY